MPALLAVAAVALYTLGVVTTVGQLRASHVDVSQAFGLIPLERHLRAGVGLLVSPWTLLVLVIFPLLYFAVPREGEPALPVKLVVAPTGLSIFGLLFLVVTVVISSPWPDAILTLIGIFGMGAAIVIPETLGGKWLARRPLVHALTAFLLVVTTAGVDAYWRGDPLPLASLNTETRKAQGPLIGVSDGLVYLAPRDSDGLYVALPATKVEHLEVTPQEREQEPTIPDLIGF